MAALLSNAGFPALVFADINIISVRTVLASICQKAGLHDILAEDETNVSVYRLKGGKRFTLVKWFACSVGKPISVRVFDDLRYDTADFRYT